MSVPWALTPIGSIAAANNIEDYSGTAAQNTQMLALLKEGTLIDPDAEPTPAADCFPACDASFTMLAAALESVGADASYAYRKEIAAANGVSYSEGTRLIFSRITEMTCSAENGGKE